MSFRKSLAAFTLLSLASAPALAAGDTVLGRMNLKTGTFAPLPALAAGASSPKTYTGTIQATLTIQVKSTMPAKQTYLCGISVEVFDPAGLTEGPSASASIAQAASDGTLKCVVTIPYSWVLAPSSTLTASANWTVTATQTTGATRTAGGSFAGFNPETSTATKLSATGEL
jgi:hypothetical protein